MNRLLSRFGRKNTGGLAIQIVIMNFTGYGCAAGRPACRGHAAVVVIGVGDSICRAADRFGIGVILRAVFLQHRAAVNIPPGGGDIALAVGLQSLISW